MERKCVAIIGIFFAMMLLFGCNSSSNNNEGSNNNGGAPIANPSFATNIQTIFNSSCAIGNCHDNTAQGGLVLLSGQSYGNLVNVPSSGEPNRTRIIPSDADNSYVVVKLEGRQNVGERMPLTGSISSTQLQNIKNWINQGAQNN